MFIAKFSVVDNTNGQFSPDKNGNLPLIGDVLAGTARASIVNGTIAQRENIEPNVMYLCDNEHRDYTNPDTGEVSKQIDVKIIAKVSVLEYAALRKELGTGKLVRQVETVENSAEVEKPLAEEPELI